MNQRTFGTYAYKQKIGLIYDKIIAVSCINGGLQRLDGSG